MNDTEKNIYDFESAEPPALSERELCDRLEKRSAKRAAIILVFANLPVYAAALLIAARAYKTDPLVSLFCVCFVVFIAVSGILCATVYSIKEEKRHE